ncbi:type IV pilin protein [Pseudomonas sp. RP23018S]|uniref:type IV pilin protein n=1 Tax=Pseudomonas sp. RP23018S TaxID=3096037 RepID=UPI002ACA13AB|nr:type IV pilin protein [Pseudomonas sp. RP23018S]MDZ5603280.1 type IV pilin protein [Pseudomonas sp. RP23018S]
MQQGLSMIELLIVLAVTGMLAAIAYPSYQESLRRAARSEIVGQLHDAAQRLERHRVVSGGYADTDQQHASLPIGSAYYHLRARREGTRFTLVGTRRLHTMMADDHCGDFELEHTGARRNPNSLDDSQACWGS